MGMLLMATFVAVILFFFYAMAASSYGFVGGAIYFFIILSIPFAPIVISLVTALIRGGQKVKQPKITVTEGNEHFPQKIEQIKSKLKYGEIVNDYDKVFIFDLANHGETLQSSSLHCFDFKNYEKDFEYKKINFSRICKGDLYENSCLVKSVSNDEDAASIKSTTVPVNGIGLFLKQSGSFDSEYVVFECRYNARKMFEIISFIVENKKLWSFKTKWVNIQNTDVFHNFESQLQ